MSVFFSNWSECPVRASSDDFVETVLQPEWPNLCSRPFDDALLVFRIITLREKSGDAVVEAEGPNL